MNADSALFSIVSTSPHDSSRIPRCSNHGPDSDCYAGNHTTHHRGPSSPSGSRLPHTILQSAQSSLFRPQEASVSRETHREPHQGDLHRAGRYHILHRSGFMRTSSERTEEGGIEGKAFPRKDGRGGQTEDLDGFCRGLDGCCCGHCEYDTYPWTSFLT